MFTLLKRTFTAEFYILNEFTLKKITQKDNKNIHFVYEFLQHSLIIH